METRSPFILTISKLLPFVLAAAIVLFVLHPVYAADARTTTAAYMVEPLKEKLAAMSEADILKSAGRFPDIAKHWAKTSIGKLAAIDIISGMPDGTFKPDKPVQVDEFIKMTVRAMGFKPGQGMKYWAQPYIDTAIEQKILASGEFKDYTKSITRQEAARIISKAALMIEAAPNAKMDALVRSKIRDYAKIADADKQSVLTVYELGLMSGMPDGTFKPLNNLTRAEAAAVIIRYLDIKERKPFTPAADEVCIITEPDGNTKILYPPSVMEVVKAANALKAGIPESKGFVRTSFADNEEMLGFIFYESKGAFDHNSIETMQMGIDINFMDMENILKTPYHITVYDPKAVKKLHRDVVYSLFQYLFEKEADKAMAAFDNYIDYAINGDQIDRMETVEFNNRSGWFYKVRNNDVFSMHINSVK